MLWCIFNLMLLLFFTIILIIYAIYTNCVKEGWSLKAEVWLKRRLMFDNTEMCWLVFGSVFLKLSVVSFFSVSTFSQSWTYFDKLTQLPLFYSFTLSSSISQTCLLWEVRNRKVNNTMRYTAKLNKQSQI